MGASGEQIVTPGLPVLLGKGIDPLTGSTVELASDITLAVGDRGVCIMGSRHGTSSREHLSLSATGGVSFSASKTAVDFEQINNAAANLEHLRLSIWDWECTVAGTGNAQGITTASTFQRGMIFLRVPSMSAVAQTAEGGSNTGQADSLAWSATPDPAGLSIAAGIYAGNTSAPTVAGHGEIAGSAIDTNGNFQINAFQKLTAPPDPLAFDGAFNDRYRALGAVNIIGA